MKKRQVIVAISIAFVLLLSLILLITFRSKETIKNTNPTQMVHADVDGDKKLDTLYISTNGDNSYTVNIQTRKGDGFTLKPDPLIKTLGYNNKSWPMYIDCRDINNDSAQEIILQSSDEKGAIIHIYTYIKESNKLMLLVSGRYNVFGSTISSGTPVIMLGENSNSKIDFTYYTFNPNIQSTYTLDNINLGNDTLNSLASFISKDNIEVINTNSSVLSSIEKGEFLDSLLIDVKYKNGIPYECIYQVRTKPYGENSKTNLYEVKMNSVSYKNNSIQYDIKNIKLID